MLRGGGCEGGGGGAVLLMNLAQYAVCFHFSLKAFLSLQFLFSISSFLPFPSHHHFDKANPIKQRKYPGPVFIVLLPLFLYAFVYIYRAPLFVFHPRNYFTNVLLDLPCHSADSHTQTRPLGQFVRRQILNAKHPPLQPPTASINRHRIRA